MGGREGGAELNAGGSRIPENDEEDECAAVPAPIRGDAEAMRELAVYLYPSR
jgi:hypothetical protein